MKDQDWEALRLFLVVARQGGLSGAAHETGISPPTLGRRMLALERSLGRTLFARGPTGYRLAVDGEVLYERVKGMESAARVIAQWQEDVFTLPIVSLACDPWMLGYVTAQLDRLWTPDDNFRICLKQYEGGLDLVHREAHIGIVPDRPASGNLATLRAVTLAYAPFRARGRPDRGHWVSLGTDVARAPWTRWTFSRPELAIMAWTNAPTNLVPLIAAGAGQGILPCFVGDGVAELERVGPPVVALGHDSWLVMHDDERRRSEVRVVIDRLKALFEAERDLFAGDRATGGGSS